MTVGVVGLTAIPKGRVLIAAGHGSMQTSEATRNPAPRRGEVKEREKSVCHLEVSMQVT